MIPNQRHLFSLTGDVHYLNCASRAPLLKSAEAAGMAGIQWQRVPESVSGAQYFEQSEQLRGLLATLIHTSPHRVAIVPAVSYGIAIAAANTPLQSGRNVVLPEEEFPSDVYAWMARCQESGAELRTVPRPLNAQRPGAEWSARIADAIGPDTAVVNLSTVHWTDGVILDMETIGQRARDVGALFIVDGTQSVGAHPFDFQAIAPDLLVCAGYKWLLGPYQIGFAALGDRLLQATPFENHWSNRAGSEDVGATTYHPEYRDGARRFDGGEHANRILLPMLSEGVRQVLEWGVENIRNHCADLTGAFQQRLEGEGFLLAPQAERVGHIMGLRLAGEGRIPAIMAALRERNVRISQRGDALRVSPHVYNDSADMDVLLEGLSSALR